MLTPHPNTLWVVKTKRTLGGGLHIQTHPYGDKVKVVVHGVRVSRGWLWWWMCDGKDDDGVKVMMVEMRRCGCGSSRGGEGGGAVATGVTRWLRRWGWHGGVCVSCRRGSPGMVAGWCSGQNLAGDWPEVGGGRIIIWGEKGG
ncbi:hypothetical protein Tco_0347696 [Tanacetum coccineum]